MKPDFSGYATKYGVKCSDGKTIVSPAFKGQDGSKVPLVWQHQHHMPGNVLGHAVMEHRDDGVYAYGYLNDTQAAKDVKEQILHGDINALSIFANQLEFDRGNIVNHGMIREVSLVLAGANPGAHIDQVSFAHSDDFDTEEQAVIYSGESLSHADGDDSSEDDGDNESGDDVTVADVYNAMSEDQKKVVAYLVTEAAKGGESVEQSATEEDDPETPDEDENDLEEEDTDKDEQLKHHNLFEGSNSAPSEGDKFTLTHDQISTIKKDFQRVGSFREAILMHADEYGITNIDMLFPEAKTLGNQPDFIKRRTEWVSKVLGGVSHTPFANVKTRTADITHEEARAKGYVKGNLKKEEFFSLKSRETTPTTVYKKQKLDRDDILDASDFDVVSWIKAEMRLMLDEEIARAILFGDGREVDTEDKILDPQGASSGKGIRSIAHDDEFYAYDYNFPANASGESKIEGILRAMDDYQGTGSPTLYTSRSEVTDMLLLKDRLGRRLYDSKAALASAMGVADIVDVDNSVLPDDLVGIIVNLTDYNTGTNRGGEINFFEDFDIDYNQEKYLYETRLSGALTKYRSAIKLRRASGTMVVPTDPGFDPETNTLTIPAITGVVYHVNDKVSSGDVVITEDVVVEAFPEEGYYFRGNSQAIWEFTFTE